MTATYHSKDHLDYAKEHAGPPRGRWGARMATAVTLYHLGRQAQQAVRSWRDRTSYQVTLLEHDPIYPKVQQWLLDVMPPAQQRSLEARTIHKRGEPLSEGPTDLADVFTDPPPPQVVLGFEGTRTQTVTLGAGHRVTVRIEREDGGDLSAREGAETYHWKPRKIIFNASSLAGRQAVTDFLQEIADTLTRGKRIPRLFTASRWGGDWIRLRELPARPLDTVVLPRGHLDDVMADLRRFLSSEGLYIRLGLPYHRGYLFHGPPGCGKTTTARALAANLGLDVFYVSLSDMDKDTALNTLLGQIPPRSVLLLEDIDIVHAAKTRDDAERKGITLAGLLNALDGVVTPHGLVTMMTTNNRDALDEALVRPGRADLEVEMTYLVREQAERLIYAITGTPVDLATVDPWPTVTAAELVGICTEHMHDLPKAVDDMLALLYRLSTDPDTKIGRAIIEAGETVRAARFGLGS